MPENRNEYGERLARIEAKLDSYSDAQERRWEEIDHRLFGNGQPGIVDRFDQRISKLERFRWTLGGMLTAGSVAGGAAAHKLFEMMGIGK